MMRPGKVVEIPSQERAVIAHAVGPQQHFPSFQFHDGDVSVLVADANSHLFERIDPSEASSARAALAVQ